MSFQGFVISDYAAINEIPNENDKQQIRTSIDAGMDMVMVPQHYQEFFEDLKDSRRTAACRQHASTMPCRI